jgi:HK97 family phage prohead protease
MQTRDFRLSVKALSDEGAFTGLAATYSNVDLTGDIIEPGSFRQAIAQQKGGYPLLWSHRQDEPIGIGRIEDSKDGLLVHGQLLMADPAAVRAHAHIKAGTIKGLSIGFTVPRGEGKVQYRDDGVRVLKEIFLHEISVVAVPANPKAQVLTVKSLGEVRHMLTSLKDGDITEDLLSDLFDIHRELKRLLADRDPENQREDTLRELRAFASGLKAAV